MAGYQIVAWVACGFFIFFAIASMRASMDEKVTGALDISFMWSVIVTVMLSFSFAIVALI